MKFKPVVLATALALVCGTLAHAGTLSPSLQQAANEVGFQGDLPVIVQFAETVDTEALRAEANRIAWELYPDDTKKRDKERTKRLRKLLVEALKDQAKDSEQQVEDFLKSHKEKRKLKLLWSRNAVAGLMPAQLLEELAEQPGVVELKLDAKVQGPGPGAAPTAPVFWNLDATGIAELWQLGFTGLDTVVATLDTGVDASHPDLGPRWRGGANSWFDPNGQHASPADNNGHGTQVMGLIVGGDAGGYQIGLAPDATWIAAKIFDNANQATLSGIHDAYQWLLDPDDNPNTDDAPDIVNNSWDLTNTVNQCNQEFATDLTLLADSDIAVVFAGGNYGPNPESSVSPANDPSVTAVGAIDSYMNIDVQSSRGPGACDGGVFPHLVAPGDGVLTADRMPTFYNFVSGTSFAVAHLAGGLAVLKEAFPEATASQLRGALMATAGDLGDPGPDHDFGHGVMDLPAAYGWLATNLGGGAPVTLQLGAATASVDENVASLTISVLRSGGSSGEASVDYATGDGSATAGEDYQATSGTLTLFDGEGIGSLTIELLDDSLVEGDEMFSVTLSNPVGATLGSPADTQVTIIDDDPLDSDGDGVGDPLDLCANTPAGEPVDAYGCSASQLDADDDGVMDALDQCPDTAAGEPVDPDGCSDSQRDSDGDGVSDAQDLCPTTPPGTSVDAVGCPVGPADADGDGFAADLDCNDADASVYPGASEIGHDGIDQDCNGFDLTIDVTRARYVSRQDKLVIWATSSLDAGAALRADIGLQGGGSIDRALSWSNSKGRWQKTLKSFAARFGSAPASLTVYGPEGEVTVSVEQR